MKKKLSLTNVAKTELKKSEMKKTLGGGSDCYTICNCVCQTGGFVSAIMNVHHDNVAGFIYEIENPEG